MADPDGESAGKDYLKIGWENGNWNCLESYHNYTDRACADVCDSICVRRKAVGRRSNAGSVISGIKLIISAIEN